MPLSINYHLQKNKIIFEIIEKITPLIENTAMRFNLIPIEIEFIKENAEKGRS